jgi:hypothetical protein
MSLSLSFWSATSQAQTMARPAEIVSVTPGGVGYVTSSTGTTGLTAQIGRWDAPYPNPDTGERAPGLEPDGASTLRVTINVNDGGLVSFNYRLRTYDAGIYDWFDASLENPSGTKSLVSQLGKPGSAYGTYFETPSVALSQSLDQWRNQQVTFVFSVQQDGWGDQTSADIINFAVRTCQVPPLSPLDADAQSFEDGQTINTAGLTADMQTALTCFQGAVQAAGGTFTLSSAYRPPSYQTHLREVWDRWNDLRNRREAECQNLRTQVQTDFNRHGLLLTQRPASAGGPHTTGSAFDARISLPGGQNVDTVAAGCQLQRPLPANDPVHFTHQ